MLRDDLEIQVGEERAPCHRPVPPVAPHADGDPPLAPDSDLARDENDVGIEFLAEERLEAAAGAAAAGGGAFKETIEALERRLIERALAAHDGNRTHAAAALGMSVRNLQKKLSRYA